MLDTTDATPAPRSARRTVVAVGARVGRHEILELIGTGGMGEVYRARHLDLDRQVAIKVVRSDLAGRDASSLLPEAQAMAKLSHPNVVVVYEVGTVDEQVYLAMEYVAGETLRRWLAREPRPWRDVLAALLPAARGLAAAHRAGIVHRDFKPDNVLVGADGRVRVVDFGLAGGSGGGEPSVVSSPDLLGSQDTISFSAVAVGTPAYMAPEQHLREPLDARCDQFAFCVTLFEALYGRRPFSGTTLGELRRNVVRHELDAPPPGSPVPRWVRSAVLRGLGGAPDERFPSMDALIDALEADPALRRRRLAVGGAVVAALGVGAFGLLSRKHDEAGCQPASLAGIWDDAIKARVHDSFVASGRPYAEDSYRRLALILDAYTAEASTMHVDACQATAVRHEQSPALLDARMGCLERRLTTVRELAALLVHADGDLVDKSVRAASTLDALGGCADADSLLAIAPPATPEMRERVAALRGRLERAVALRLAGRYKPAQALARAVVIEAQAVGYTPAVAEAQYEAGASARAAGDARGAEPSLGLALELAAKVKDGPLEARSYALLLYVVGWDLGRVSDAAAMIPGARAVAARAGSDQRGIARIHSGIAAILERAGRYDEARQEADVALGLLPPESLESANVLNLIGVGLRRGNRGEEALKEFQRAQPIYEKLLGAEHPDNAGILLNLGTTLYDLGRYAEAEVDERRALALFERTLGPDHPDVARVLNNLSTTLLALDRRDESIPVLRRALAIKEATLGPDHLDVSTSLINLSHVLQITGHDEEALATAQRSLAILEKVLGPDSAQLVNSLDSAIDALRGLHRDAEALAMGRRALALASKDDPEGTDVAGVLSRVGALKLAEGQAKEGLADADHAIAIYDKKADARVAQPLIERATILRALGRDADAEAALDRAAAQRGPEQARMTANVAEMRAGRARH